MKPKTPFNETFQSWAVYAVAVLSGVGLISWGWDRRPWILAACVAGVVVILVVLLKFSAWLAGRHDAHR